MSDLIIVRYPEPPKPPEPLVPFAPPSCPACGFKGPMRELEFEEKGVDVTEPCPKGTGAHTKKPIPFGWACGKGHRFVGRFYMQCSCGWRAEPDWHTGTTRPDFNQPMRVSLDPPKPPVT